MPSPVRALVAAALAGALAVGGAAGAQEPVEVNDPGLGRQWALERIGAPTAWSVATGEGTTIAIVDSGIDLAHPDLRDKIDGSVDCVGHDDVAAGCVTGGGIDDAGHGTHVAGIAAASTDNGQGVAGVAPRARLLAVRVLANRCAGDEPSDCEAEGTETDVADGIRWAADHGAEVINLSLGSITQSVVGPGRAFAEALEHAWSKGAIPVVVAGNDLLLPGSVVDVPAVVVAATDADDRSATYSNGVGNVRWGVAAPGGESDTPESCEAETPRGILSTYHRPARSGEPGVSGYACVAGTSMAAPQVSGALAVLRSAGFDPREAVERLLDTARDLGRPGRDSTFGAGRIDLAAAVAGVEPTGQPVRATSAGDETDAGVGPSSTTTPASAPATVVPPTTTPPVAGDLPAPAPTTTTAPAGDDGADDDDERAGAVAVARRRLDTDELPSGPLTLAVLAIVALSAAHAWRYLASTGLARRTPE